jgi:hypothetical protein
MGKIDQFDNAINHGVAEGYEGINAPPGQPSEKKLKKIFHVKLLRLLEIILGSLLKFCFTGLAGLKKTGGRLESLPPEKSALSLSSLREFQLLALAGGFLGRPDWCIARPTQMGPSSKRPQ